MGVFETPPRFVKQFLKANRNLGQTQRYRDASRAEQYYYSLQYDGLLPWEANAPLRKKKPRVILPLYKTAIDSIDRFVWGGTRFPKILVSATRRDDEPSDPNEIGPELAKEDAKALTTFCNALVQQAQLGAGMREGAMRAMVTTSAAIIFGVRGGYLTVRSEAGKHCTPTWRTDNPRRLAKLEVMYQYEAEEPNGQSGTIKRLYWYRQTIDEQNDTVYKPVLVSSGQVDPEWVVDTDRSVKHNLGFCPVQWVRTRPLSSDSIDGQFVIDPSLYGLLDRLNYGLSQLDRGVEYSQDPQWLRKGVPSGQRNQLQKSPGAMWDVDKEASVEMIEAKGTGAATALEHLRSLKEQFFSAACVVMVEPSKLSSSGNISGTVLEWIYKPMLDLASDLRCDFGDAFTGLLNLALRICTVVSLRGQDIWIPGVGRVAKLLSKAQLQGVWLDVPITLQWGTFFAPTLQEKALKVQAAISAQQAGLVSKATATADIAPEYHILDVEAEREGADKEFAEQADFGSMMSGTGLKQPGGSMPGDKKSPAPAIKPPRPGSR